MIQNIKVDIVYFMTATDFEFEFNLGSCCHMRLLNDKAKDKKSFVNSLARAVSRSQIIISCGPLFGEDGLIATAAAAISHDLETVDNKTYGIQSESNVQIIKGSVPLVTPEGYFGGCIIESGDQTIILLTENRTLRKSIMKNLIHPYIEDVSIMQSAEKIAAASESEEIKAEAPAPAVPVSEQEQAIEPQTDVLPTAEQQETLTDETPSGKGEVLPEPEAAAQPQADTAQNGETGETDGDHNIGFDFSSDGETVTENNETEKPEDEAKPQESEDFDSIFIRGVSAEETGKKEKKGISIWILVVTLVLLLVVFGLLYFLLFMPMLNGVSTSEYVRGLFSKAASLKYI